MLINDNIDVLGEVWVTSAIDVHQQSLAGGHASCRSTEQGTFWVDCFILRFRGWPLLLMQYGAVTLVSADSALYGGVTPTRNVAQRSTNCCRLSCSHSLKVAGSRKRSNNLLLITATLPKRLFSSSHNSFSNATGLRSYCFR